LSSEPCASETQIGSQVAVQTRQKEAGANVCEEADRRLGHGKHGAFRCHTVLSMHRDSCSSAHCDAVKDRDNWLGIGRNQVVQGIFHPEELALSSSVASFPHHFCKTRDRTRDLELRTTSPPAQNALLAADSSFLAVMTTTSADEPGSRHVYGQCR